MPIPGPRAQSGPLPGYRNPDNAAPTLFNHWKRPGTIYWPGRSPGLMTITLRGCVLGAGQIRRLWRQSVDLIPAQAAYSWTNSAPSPDRPILSPGPLDITRALRYMTRSVYVAGGTDNTRFDALHTIIRKQNHYKTITVGRGQSRSRPTVRNRMTSFGSRVPTLNQQVEAAETQAPPATSPATGGS